ncbi:MAG: hypothetical protein HZA46_05410 [Planctomycetales bacterium]|nr:hypothetical protein [Planctomycetales bacterium]
MSLQGAEQLSFEWSGLESVQVEVSEAPLTSDAGLILIRQLDEVIRWTEQFAAALGDRQG